MTTCSCLCFFKRRTAFEMRISDWSSDVCSSDHATRRNLTGAVTRMLEEAGLRVVASKRIRMTRDLAEGFYAVHKERPFFGEQNGSASWRESICENVYVSGVTVHFKNNIYNVKFGRPHNRTTKINNR